MEKVGKTTVFYDGLCRLCSREINHYRRQAGAENMAFVDICAPGFDARQEGVDPFRVHKVMHVRRADGSLAVGVEAFIEIWHQLPKFRKFARAAKSPLVRPLLELGYALFAVLRPFLPRRRAALDCAASPYCEVKDA